MSDETPEKEPQEPKRRRRRRSKEPSDAPSAPEAQTASAEEASAEEPPAEEAMAEDSAEEPSVDEAPAEETLAEEPAAEREPEPTPKPRRRGGGQPRAVRARARYVRSSPRKARLVCDHIRGKSVEEARAILAHTPRAVARDWSKLLESAVANAENNHELVGEDLYIDVAHADDGPTIKRYRPRAMGRATRIHKRTSHLTILLIPR